jgi:uncharacterized membrane protein YfcA
MGGNWFAPWSSAGNDHANFGQQRRSRLSDWPPFASRYKPSGNGCPRATKSVDVDPWGAIGGFTGTTAAIPLVPLALVMSRYKGPKFRSTLNGWGMMMAIVSVVTLTAANEIDRSHLAVAAVLACAATAGLFLSGPLRHVVDRRGAAQAVYAVGALGAVALLVRSLT